MTMSGFCCTNSGVAAMNTGIGSTLEKSIRSLPMPSATAMTLYGSTFTMASTVFGAGPPPHVFHVHADFLVIALLQAVLRHDGVDEDVADRRAGLVGDFQPAQFFDLGD